MNSTPAAIEISGVHKSYRLGRTTLKVLRGVGLTIAPGEFVAVVGASGRGKSTLLHVLGLLDRCDRGTIRLDGRDVETLGSRERNRMRCQEIGFVFQFYHLLPELNVLENVLLPARVDSSVAGWLGRRRGAVGQAAETLRHVGLAERMKHRPRELSGGERQRVAIARALMNRPKFLLADEPTGNLDSATGQQIMEVLRGVSREVKQTVVMVTHDADLARRADRVLHLRDGRLAQ